MHDMRRSPVSHAGAPPQLPELRTPTAPRARWVRHAAVCALIGCAMVTVMRWWAWAWAPASVIAILYLMYASIEMAESRSRALQSSLTDGPRPATQRVLVERERIGARILVTLLSGVLAIALVVAALVLDWKTLGVGTAMTFGVIVFVGLPTWAAAVGDSMPVDRR